METKSSSDDDVVYDFRKACSSDFLKEEEEMDKQALMAAETMEQSIPFTPSPFTPSPTAPAVRVFVVRHAERADECGRDEKALRQASAEKKTNNPIHRADSLLTEKGLAQAGLCAQVLRQRIPNNDDVVVYTSPLCRCAQTASAISCEFNVPVRPVASLGQCALAIRRAGLERAIDNIYQPSESLSRICNGAVEFQDRVDDVNHDFVQGVEHLVLNELHVDGSQKMEENDGAGGGGPRDVIIVAHREAFYGNLFKLTNRKLPYKPPYCAIGEFMVVEKSGGGGGGGGLEWHLIEFDVGYTVPQLEKSAAKKYARTIDRSFDSVGIAAHKVFSLRQ